MFVTPIASKTQEKIQYSKGSVKKQGLKLNFGKGKGGEKLESPVSQADIGILKQKM